MICLDSTFLIDILRGKEIALNKFNELKEEKLVTTQINVYEILKGVYGKSEKANNSAKSLLLSLIHLDLNFDDAKYSAKIANRLENIGKKIGEMDSLIAGIMLSNNCNKIITRNSKHFSIIKELDVIEY